MRSILVVGSALVAVAAIISIISAAIPFWIDTSQDGVRFYFGLWKSCVADDASTICSDITGDELPSWFLGVRAMAVLGLLCLCGSTVAACVFVRLSTKRMIAILSIVLAIIGGVCCLISVIVYGAKETVNKSDFGAGFYLNIVAAILAVASAITIILSQREASGYTSF